MNHFKLTLKAVTMLLTAVLATHALANESVDVELHKVNANGQGESVGTVTLKEHRDGVLIKPSLKNLEPGLHGFHLHENPSCAPAEKDGNQTAAAAAGGHYDPEETGAHKGPYNPDGHLGDLPALFVDENQEATLEYLAPRLQLGDFTDKALVIHSGGDNYSDQPKPLGGGEKRIACGVVHDE